MNGRPYVSRFPQKHSTSDIAYTDVRIYLQRGERDENPCVREANAPNGLYSTGTVRLFHAKYQIILTAQPGTLTHHR
jgi:hypothetical protein